MAKKTKMGLPIVSLVGMILVLVGFICPMFDFKLGTLNGFDFIDFGNSGFVSIGAILIFIGSIAGIGAAFLPKIKNLKLIALAVVLIGILVLVIGFTTNGGVYKAIGKGLFKLATTGFYLVIAGSLISIIGFVMKK